MAVGTAQAVTGYIGQSNMSKAVAANAQQATTTNYLYTQNRINQEGAAAIQQKTNAEIATLKAQGTANTAAGEAGVHGLSVDAINNDYLAQLGRQNDAVDQNYQMQRQYLIGEMASQQARGQSQINSAPPPSLLDAGLKIAASGLSAGQGYYKNTSRGY